MELHDSVRATSRLLVDTPDVVRGCGSKELAELTAEVLAIMQRAESAAVVLAAEAHARGLVSESTAANLAQWVAHLGAGSPVHELLPSVAAGGAGPLVPIDEATAAAETAEGLANAAETPQSTPVPGLETAHAARIARVALECGKPKNEVAKDALASGDVSVASTDAAIKHTNQIMPILSDWSRDKVLTDFLTVSADAGIATIKQLSKILKATFATEEALEEVEAKQDAVESVTWAELDNGLHRLTADLAPTHAARIKAALAALTAPSPGNTCCSDVFHRHAGDPTGDQDVRPVAKRAADALMLVVDRGAEAVADEGQLAKSGSTQLVVTTSLEVLQGILSGYGLTSDGEVLTPTEIRHLACDADVIPMVLDSDGQPLDVGRQERLATKAIRRAVAFRDRHCTFGDCDRPPSWGQVHHIVPWYAGGHTTLDNSALLCARHHTIVHRDRLTATIKEGRVIWNMTPGLMATTTHSDNGRSGAA